MNASMGLATHSRCRTAGRGGRDGGVHGQAAPSPAVTGTGQNTAAATVASKTRERIQPVPLLGRRVNTALRVGRIRRGRRSSVGSRTQAIVNGCRQRGKQ